MPFSIADVEQAMLTVVHGVLDAAWSEFQQAGHTTNAHPLALRILMADRILTEVKAGDRDPVRLKALALQAIVGRNGTA